MIKLVKHKFSKQTLTVIYYLHNPDMLLLLLYTITTKIQRKLAYYCSYMCIQCTYNWENLGNIKSWSLCSYKRKLSHSCLLAQSLVIEIQNSHLENSHSKHRFTAAKVILLYKRTWLLSCRKLSYILTQATNTCLSQIYSKENCSSYIFRDVIRNILEYLYSTSLYIKAFV